MALIHWVRQAAFLLLLSALTVPSASGQLQYRIVDQYANDMVYDPASKKILMSIPSKDAVNGNAVGAFDPDAAKLSGSWFIGSEPNPIALTGTSRYLYVGLDGSGTVVKFDLSTKKSVQTVSMGVLPFYGTRLAGSIACQPGTDSVVAVAWKFPTVSPSAGGVGVYGNGIKRPDTIAKPGGTINRVHFWGTAVDAFTLYGLNNETSGRDFYNLQVTPTGVQKFQTVSGLTDGSQDFHIEGARAVFDRGKMIDLSTSPPSSYATFNLSTAWGSNPPKACFDKALNLWCFASRGFWTDSIYIQRFNASTFLLKDVLIVGKMKAGSALNWNVNNMIYLGDSSHYAISTADGQLVLINGYQKSTAAGPAPYDDAIAVYPNPTSDGFYVDYKTPVNVQVLSAVGTPVLEQRNTRSVSLRALPASLYTVRVSDLSGRLLQVEKVRKD